MSIPSGHWCFLFSTESGADLRVSTPNTPQASGKGTLRSLRASGGKPSYCEQMISPHLLVAALAIIAVFSLLSAASAQAEEPPGEASRFELIVLGRAQDGGMPHVGCNRPCCVEARETGRHELPASVGVIDRETGKLLLFEATPAIDAQLALLPEAAGVTDRGRQPVDGVLLEGPVLGGERVAKQVRITGRVCIHNCDCLGDYTDHPYGQSHRDDH